ncbi:MAG: glucose-6-phosphate isomerase [Gemmatimonas sp.]
MARLPYTHDIRRAVGACKPAYRKALDSLPAALKKLKAQHDDGSLPLLRVAARRDDLESIAAAARRFRMSFADVIVLGTGGSSLGAQTLVTAAQAMGKKGPRLHFLDNVDPIRFEDTLNRVDLKRTGFLAVSKSGSTAETALQTLAALRSVKAAAGERGIRRQFLVITEPAKGGKANPMRRLAERNSIPVLDHDPGIGGRYSALTNVGLLPAAIAGFDPAAIRRGARAVVRGLLNARSGRGFAPAEGAALKIALEKRQGVTQSVLMPYVDALQPFAFWYRQLWAESLGKNGKGTTPINALGAVDQHSQLQLYLDGPADKLITVIAAETEGVGPVIRRERGLEPEFDYLVGHAMGDLIAAEAQATADTLAKHDRPVRMIRINEPDEETMGALMMHYMLETILAAALLRVDPYDQPAVEEGKVLARRYLAKMG